MQLTRTEASVVARLRSKRVATMNSLRQQLRVSHMSVVRAIKKYGYYTSINHNAAYYTLHDIPRFDADGLWSYRDICFSSYRTLAKTLVALVQNAPAGMSVAQLEQRLNTNVANLLSRLCQQKELTRCFVGRQAVYLAVEPQLQQRQRDELQLQQQTPATMTASGETDNPSFPPRCDVVLVLEVLIQIIKAPTADAAALAKAIRARGLQINARQVQRVIDFYSLPKKKGTLAVAELALSLLHRRIDQIKRSGQLPDHAQYTFDELDRLMALVREASAQDQTRGIVLKTTARTVVTLKYGTFEAREVVRQEKTPDGPGRILRSSQLAGLVAPGYRYGYDLVVHVGLESFLFGRRIKEIREGLEQGSPAIRISDSSLDELRRRFLFHFGQVHRQAAPALRESLNQPGGLTWLIDGTVEPATPVFFGVQEARSTIVLGSWKIPTENADDMVPCLKETAQTYGRPKRVLHDLSSAMSLACERALHQVPHHVCHYHFACDVGEDLLATPQRMLTSRLQALKLQVRLREQRKTQTQWLREHAGQPQAELVLQRLLAGEQFTADWTATLAREVLLAFHFWILDYAADGSRQGFPFDPYWLYFHRRLVTAHDALVRLLTRPAVASQAPKPLWNLRDQLQRYCRDPQIITASSHYEKAYHEFQRLRTILRLGAQGPSPMRDAYELTTEQQRQIQESLDPLCDEYRQRIESCSDEVERDICTIVLSHLQRYLPQLLPDGGFDDQIRTTNPLEAHWGEGKRACRHTQGRRKLTRTFQALPGELMLIPNLRKPEYVNIVLGGSLDHLAAKFAEANSDGSSYAAWRRTNSSLNLGRVPSRILRQEDFVAHVIDVYDAQCHANNKQVA